MSSNVPVRSRVWHWLRLGAINALVTTILLILVLVSVEVYLRATIPESSGGSIFESTTRTRRYKVMKPDTRIVAWGREFRTNRLGFRDNKLDIPVKQPSAFRAVVLGDSFTASAGVDIDKIYPTLLQRRLEQSMPGAEVINLAVGGYNIVQYELVLAEVGLSLDPDLVIVAVFPFNDLSNDTYRANRDDALGRSIPSTPTPWYRRMYVYQAYLGRVEGRIRSWFASPPPSAGARASAQSIRETDAEENLDALTRLVQTAENRGIPVVVALLPNTDSFEAQHEDFAPFEALCSREQWQCLNLLDRFRTTDDSPGSLRLNQLDPHPNERYNELVADFLGEYLLSHIERLKDSKSH